MAQESQNNAVYTVPFFQQNQATLEHILLLACIKSFRFYTQTKSRLCPRLPDGRSFRPDFTTLEFNRIYNIVARFWEGLAAGLRDGEMGIRPDLMDLLLSKEVERKVMTVEDVKPIVEWLINDIRTIDIEPALMQHLPDSPIFLQWLEQRAIEYEQSRLHHAVLGHPPNLADLQESVRNVQKTIAPPSKTIVNPIDVITTPMTFDTPLSVTSLPGINDRTGGGFRKKEATVIAAISGGGKTVFAMQLARDFILQQRNTLVLTTEQPPWELIHRVICNHVSIDFSLFVNRARNSGATQTLAGVPVAFVPPECYADEQRWQAMLELHQRFNDHLRFVDWSEGGRSIVSDFDAAVDQVSLNAPGWEPEIVIVDWVGGGLEQRMQKGDLLRHFYKQAGETVINHGKRTGRIMFMTAQLNKTLVRPSTKYITMDMLAECKALTDNATNFVGMTALRLEKEMESKMRLQQYQAVCLDKARKGTGGSFKVELQFHFQRIVMPSHTTMKTHSQVGT